MVFSSPIFLFAFLPITLLIYFLAPKQLRNIVLLCASLIFYAFGEVFYVGVMILSIISNFIFGNLIYREKLSHANGKPLKLYMVAAIFINVGLLVAFKYANFLTDNINTLIALFGIPAIDLKPVHLPIGISFFTFQALSYIVDVYRGEVKPQHNIINLALYISLFPQLIAGPIVRYSDIAAQITKRTISIELFSIGVQRFIIGFAKKMLIANPLGEVADNVFALSGDALTMPLAWIGILSYTLQIYFDFSGYSDMAIGLGRMFGFQFRENFNYPYISKSVREFWRRWHISLSTWFRDYVYIPLGGGRVATYRVYCNLLIVFLLTGIWHGASWNFVIWGLFHGFFLASEHMGFTNKLNRLRKPVQHLYVVGVVLFSWVIFRSDTLTQAMGYYGAMINLDNFHTTMFQYAQVLSNEFNYAISFGILFSLPVYPWMKQYLTTFAENRSHKTAGFIHAAKLASLSTLFILGIFKIAASTYNPFIYFRF